MVAQQIAFAVVAALMIVGAVRVVTSNNVVHAALWLVLVLAGAAALYLLLAAEFVAITQVLVYVGAVMVLFIFGTMLTRAQIGPERALNNKSWPVALVVSLVLGGTLAYVLIDTFGDDELPEDPAIQSVQSVSDSIFGPYLIPFWALSFVLLAAMVGAIVLARKTESSSPCSASLRLAPTRFARQSVQSAAVRRPSRTHRSVAVLINEFLLLGAVLFSIGVYGVLARRNAVLVLMSIELILNSVNINLLAFALQRSGEAAAAGSAFALFIIAVAAAEVGVGLALVLLIYRNRRSIALDELSEMKG